jgi:hypothetical protein
MPEQMCKANKQVDPTAERRVQFHYCRLDSGHSGKHRCACSHEWGVAEPERSPWDA